MNSRLILLFSLALLLNNGFAQRTSWPMVNGDAMHTSRAEIEMSFPLKIVETWDIGFSSENGMTVTEDYLFLTDPADSNIVFAVDAITGDSLWQFGVPGTGGAANHVPATWQNLVIAGGQGAAGIYALSIESGEVMWFKSTATSYTRSPIITDGLLLIPGGNRLLCVDLANGVDQWSISGIIPQISPVADNSLVYFGMGGEVHAVSKWTGDSVWTAAVPNGSFSSYALDEQRLYVSQYNVEINALDKADGTVLWTVAIDSLERMNDYPSCFAQTADLLIVKFFIEGNSRNQYMVLEKATGNEVDRFEGGRMFYGSPTIINDYVVDFSGGNLVFWTIPTGDTAYLISLPDLRGTQQVLAANDRIYIGADGPSIHVLESAPLSTPRIEDGLNFNVFPNPVAQQLFVEYALVSTEDVRIEITSLNGMMYRVKKLGRQSVGEYQIAMYVSDLAVGVYWISIYAGDHVETLQFVRQ